MMYFNPALLHKVAEDPKQPNPSGQQPADPNTNPNGASGFFDFFNLPKDYGMTSAFDDVKTLFTGEGDAVKTAGNRALAYFAPRLVGSLGIAAVAKMLCGRQGGMMVPLLGAIGGFFLGGPMMDMVKKMFGPTQTADEAKQQDAGKPGTKTTDQKPAANPETPATNTKTPAATAEAPATTTETPADTTKTPATETPATSTTETPTETTEAPATAATTEEEATEEGADTGGQQQQLTWEQEVYWKNLSDTEKERIGNMPYNEAIQEIQNGIDKTMADPNAKKAFIDQVNEYRTENVANGVFKHQGDAEIYAAEHDGQLPEGVVMDKLPADPRAPKPQQGEAVQETTAPAAKPADAGANPTAAGQKPAAANADTATPKPPVTTAAAAGTALPGTRNDFINRILNPLSGVLPNTGTTQTGTDATSFFSQPQQLYGPRRDAANTAQQTTAKPAVPAAQKSTKLESKPLDKLTPDERKQYVDKVGQTFGEGSFQHIMLGGKPKNPLDKFKQKRIGNNQLDNRGSTIGPAKR